jgi:hypothetical protein
MYFLNVWSSKPCIQIRIHLKCWVPDPDSINPDQQHCLKGTVLVNLTLPERYGTTC